MCSFLHRTRLHRLPGSTWTRFFEHQSTVADGLDFNSSDEEMRYEMGHAAAGRGHSGVREASAGSARRGVLKKAIYSYISGRDYGSHLWLTRSDFLGIFAYNRMGCARAPRGDQSHFPILRLLGGSRGSPGAGAWPGPPWGHPWEGLQPFLSLRLKAYSLLDLLGGLRGALGRGPGRDPPGDTPGKAYSLFLVSV